MPRGRCPLRGTDRLNITSWLRTTSRALARVSRHMRTILEWVARASSIGTSGQPPRRAHQISLINQVALQSCAVPIPYQVFYLLHDTRRYLPLVVVNAVFMACCVATLFMNRAGKHAAARNTMFTALHVQLLVVTYFLGNGAGVHLLYFPLGAWLGLFFASR